MKTKSLRPISHSPASPQAALRSLEKGNALFARILARAAQEGRRTVPLLTVDATAFGLGAAPAQRPFATVVGCSDARVPVEMIFQKGCNDLFVVRVAGNVLTSEGLGSLDFAATQFASSLRLAIVLGHTRCGAATAAVDAFLAPFQYLQAAPTQPLRSVLDHLFIAVRVADRDLRREYGPEVIDRPGYRAALIETTVVMNAAMAACTLQRELRSDQAGVLQVVFGIYDLENHRVTAPSALLRKSGRKAACLAPPPVSREEWRSYSLGVIRQPTIRALLDAPASSTP